MTFQMTPNAKGRLTHSRYTCDGCGCVVDLSPDDLRVPDEGRIVPAEAMCRRGWTIELGLGPERDLCPACVKEVSR